MTLDPIATEPVVSADEHVPLMVEWGLVPAVVWQAVWPDGRVCCEVTIARIGGRINGLTLLNPPSVGPSITSHSAQADEEEGVPVVSMAPFEPDPDLDPQRSLVTTRCSPTSVVAGDWLEVRFTESVPVRWATTRSFGFGIDAAEELVAIRADASRVPSLLTPAFD